VTTNSRPAWLEGKTILVVEDETMVSFLIEDMLGELGCESILLASSVNEALETLNGHKPDAAVLDANLSGQFAFPVATRLAEAKIPFVFATGYGRSGIPNEWAANPVIQKPFTREALEAALRSLLS
jgi:CheY-like chemotaxis protein